MKKNDIFIIIMAVFLGGMISFFVSNALFNSKEDLSASVEVVEPISADFSEPDKRYFNGKSNNPTQLIVIGDDKNQQPFQTQN